jgi:transport and Golgi organization protein 2
MLDQEHFQYGETVCTVMVRFRPATAWPLLVAAVRDELLARPWDPPAAYWPEFPFVQGGRDRLAGGTWMAVDRAHGAVAALLNGVRLGPPEDGSTRPTRGRLPLDALAMAVPIDPAQVWRYDGFHLMRADSDHVEVWSWDGETFTHEELAPGDHIIVNLGPDRDSDPLVPHFMPLLRAAAGPEPRPGKPTADAWGEWLELLRGDGLEPTDPRALLIEHEVAGGRYGSGSAALIGVAADGAVRYDFTAAPATPNWTEIPPPDPDRRSEQMSD